MRRQAAFLLAALVLLAAASPTRSYKKALREDTRELVLYQGFQTALIMRATLLTPEFRGAYAEERRRLTGTHTEEHADFLRRNEEDAAVYYEVVFSSDSGLPEHHFGTTDQGWRLRLEADGQAQELVTVHEIRDPTTVQRALFKHLNIWSELWVARFAKTVNAPRVVELHVGSGYGHGTLTWGDRE